MKNLLQILIIFLFPMLVSSQTIQFNKAVSMEIESLSLVQVAKVGSRYYAANTGNKYLVIEGDLKSTVKKRMEIPLYKLLLKSNDSVYMALADVSYIPYSDKDRLIRFKKKARKKIYFEIPETFTKGILGYDRELLGAVEMQNDINAKLTLEEENNN